MSHPSRALPALFAGALAFGAAPALPATDAGLPVIDIHTHVFNLRYLPIRGILVARGVPKPAAEALDRLLVGATPLANLTLPADVLPADAADVMDLPTMDDATARRWVLGRVQNAAADQREILTARERRALRKYVTSVPRAPGIADAAVSPPSTDIELVGAALDRARPDPQQSVSYPRFLATLMQNEVALVRLAQHEYPAVDLMVHHLMDMERAYDDRPSLDNAHQVERLAPLAKLFPGRLFGFVAFDPFRRAKGLAVVQAATDRKTSNPALGVKFYPPSGYRASGNEDWPGKPSWWRWWLWSVRAQWTARYGGWNGAELDATNREFFAYCVKNDLPVLAHCTPDGFQAASGYGAMSDPTFWRRVLEEFPKLRLVLAHGGGGKSWFSDGPWDGTADFDQRAWDLATRYENVYLDFSYADEVLDPTQRATLQRRLRELLRPSSGPLAGRPYQLADKVIYGSDWHMVSAIDGRRQIPEHLAALFADRRDRARFLAGNASRFLRLADYARDAPLEPEQRQSLGELLERIRQVEETP